MHFSCLLIKKEDGSSISADDGMLFFFSLIAEVDAEVVQKHQDVQ